MRPAARLLAAVSTPTSNYLAPYTPTGLTGIRTHPHPRPTLLYLYSATLSKLARLPQDSVYRQSTEALTNHRLSIIESTIPKNFEKWQGHVERDILPRLESGELNAVGDIKRLSVGGKPYLFQQYEERAVDDREEEWDSDTYVGELGEGIRDEEERAMQMKLAEKSAQQAEARRGERIVNEPPLSRDQVGDLEERIGAGLIEEVVAVAQRELELVDVMLENKVYVPSIMAQSGLRRYVC